MVKKNPVVHFEMPMKDRKRVSRFYQSAFGWDMQDMGEDYGGYLMAMTSESDKNGPKKKGRINGGFYPKQKDSENCHLVVSVDNLKKAMSRVKKSGGKLIGKPMNISNVGEFIMIKDTEGNKIGLLQPVEM